MTYLLRVLVLASLVAGTSGAALAASPAQQTAPVKTASVPSADAGRASQIVKQAEEYLAGVDTVKARFVQTAPDGVQRVGIFYMNRPGKMRFEYDAPIKDMVVADGIQLYYYDGELKQTSSAPVGQTLADFLLRKNIKLSGDVRVMGVQEGGGLTQITLTQKADPGAGSMTLGFTEAPFGLKKWRVTDAQGQITEVELFDVQENLSLPGSLFVYKDPRGPQAGYN